MRAVFLLVLSLVVAGCAQGPTPAGDQSTPADFAGTVEYANGSLPPPYHYEWRLTFDASKAVVEWRPGYDSATEPWRKTADITADQRKRLYGQLRDLGVFGKPAAEGDGMDGGPGGNIEITAGGRTYDPGSLGGNEGSARLLKGVADAVRELVPADVWDGLKAEQDEWSARQAK
jgi:hypothetical protein